MPSLQNLSSLKFLRVCLFCKSDSSINVLYSTLGVLKLDDIIMEHAKFLFKFNNDMLSDYFKDYFVELETIHYYHTCQKTKKIFFTLLPVQNGGER